MVSAVEVGIICKLHSLGPWLPSSWLGVLSALIFAWATLGRLGWRSWKQNTPEERFDRGTFHVLYWVGMYLATMSLL